MQFLSRRPIPPSPRTARARVALKLLVLLGAGCEVRSFPITEDWSIGGGPDAAQDRFVFIPGIGGAGGSGVRSDAMPSVPDGAVRLPDGGLCVIVPEVCDGVDNDCDGEVDNGFDVMTHPAHCGRCGNVCQLPHAFPKCEAGRCAVRECLPGWFDVDGAPDNGCECLRSNGGVELCDGADNDCDGQIDEDFDLTADTRNCGRCGVICEFPRADARCEAGECKMGACEPGYLDLDGRKDGCEYFCSPTPDPTEVCDGVDNDCDGQIDNNPRGEGAPCGPDVVNTGVCKRGVMTCTSGQLICLGAVQPGIESCDGLDNDCDGLTDEGFDKLRDIRYCGNCQPCAIPNAVPRCNQGVCEIEQCSPGWVRSNPNLAACDYACTFTGMEICNGRDDDCDGQTDEGFTLETDPYNCGQCGRICSFPNAAPVCMNGTCERGPCNQNFHDLDPNQPGCEYFCVRTGAVELCDGRDNDCDGQIDEDFILATDPSNCGRCGNVCRYNNAAASCNQGQCMQGACNAGYVDVDGDASNGCEYACTPTGPEVCDGRDNDCDTLIDESDPQLNARCYPPGETGCDVVANSCNGTCQQGRYVCLGGQLACQGYRLPEAERCDDRDNDCDGRTDEDFDKQNDPRFCGNCQTQCSYANAVALCQAGACRMGPCTTGWVDLNRDMNGCEYACTMTGPEVCDGRDNDCDGLTDTADSDLLYPAMNFCRQLGECGNNPPGGGLPRYAQNTYPVCVQQSGMTRPDWVCNYPASVQTTGPNLIVAQESWCDGLDNDCDGATDEHVPSKGQPCFDNGIGECQRRGTLACVPGNREAPVSCQYPGPANTPQHELCDNKDNDCDGHTDEIWDDPSGNRCGGGNCRGVRDAMATVTAGGYRIYQYEASRPDATNGTQGLLTTRACSTIGVRPWTSLTYSQAQAACRAAGKRLCRTNRTTCAGGTITSDEWGSACASGRSCTAAQPTFPYGCSYGAQICNGADNTQGNGGALPSGTVLTSCFTNDLDTSTPGNQRAFDMSGNVSEWTEDCGGTLEDNRRIYTLRGGDYLSGFAVDVPSALECDFFQVQVAENYAHPSTGFRCCTICADGLAECNGVCVNLANSTANCGACGNACQGNQICSNGRCTN